MPNDRYLHENAMGSTLAITDQWADRRAGYEYIDSGQVLHSPVLLDGKYISGVQPHPSYADVSVVTLSEDVLEANELTGREFRAVKKAPGGPDDVYLTGTVLSHDGTVIHVHDEGNAISSAWNGSELNAEQTAVFDLHEGMYRGVIDSREGTGAWTFNGWYDSQSQSGEPCTYLKVDHAPFESWMISQEGDFGNYLKVHLTDGSNNAWLTVLGVTSLTPENDACYEIAVKGDCLPAWIDTGVWYTLDGRVKRPQAAQSGVWHDDASGGTTTTFKLSPRAWLSEHMVGWTLQPDVRWQVFVPITGVDENANTLTVAGDYSSRGGEGTRFRIYAPPGVVTGRKVAGVGTNGAGAGALSRWTSAGSSRHLYAGYRYESPLAGFYIYGSDSTEHRQSGKNFAGVRAANAPERRNAPQGKLHAVPALRSGIDALHVAGPGGRTVLQPAPLRRKLPGRVL